MKIEEVILWAIGFLVVIGVPTLIYTIISATKLGDISQDIKTLIGMIKEFKTKD